MKKDVKPLVLLLYIYLLSMGEKNVNPPPRVLKQIGYFAVFSATLFLSACASSPNCVTTSCTTEITTCTTNFPCQPPVKTVSAETTCATPSCARLVERHSPVKVTATGYGASSAFDGYTPGQRRLMAMRASKLDAYRALAEQVQGVRVTGNSTVAAMITQNDSYRVYVDSVVQGARIVTVTPMAEGNYETQVELELDDRFFGIFLPSAASCGVNGVVTPACASYRAYPQPMPQMGIRGYVGPANSYSSSYYMVVQ